MKYRAYDIEYETDGQKVKLPKVLDFEITDPESDPSDGLADLISDRTGWLVKGFKVGIVQVERKVEITYRWWNASGKSALVNPDHVEALHEGAKTRINEQMTEGCTSGELNEAIPVCLDDTRNVVEYRGHWEAKES